jgi:hypothetical protein
MNEKKKGRKPEGGGNTPSKSMLEDRWTRHRRIGMRNLQDFEHHMPHAGRRQSATKLWARKTGTKTYNILCSVTRANCTLTKSLWGKWVIGQRGGLALSRTSDRCDHWNLVTRLVSPGCRNDYLVPPVQYVQYCWPTNPKSAISTVKWDKQHFTSERIAVLTKRCA